MANKETQKDLEAAPTQEFLVDEIDKVWEIEKPEGFGELLEQWGFKREFATDFFRNILWEVYLLTEEDLASANLVSKEDWLTKVRKSFGNQFDVQRYFDKLKGTLNKMLKEEEYPLEWFLEVVGGFEKMRLVLKKMSEVLVNSKQENRNLERRIEELGTERGEENQTLRERIAELEKEFEDFTDEEGKRELKLLIQGLERKVRTLELELEEAREVSKKERDLQEKLDVALESNQKLGERLNREVEISTRRFEENQRLNKESRLRGQKLSEAQNQIATLNIRSAGVENEKDNLLGEALRLQTEILNLQQKLRKGEETMRDWFQAAIQDSQKNRMENTRLRTEREILQKELEEMTFERDTLATKLDSLEEKKNGKGK
jgi:chromosome segregation ATPase